MLKVNLTVNISRKNIAQVLFATTIFFLCVEIPYLSNLFPEFYRGVDYLRALLTGILVLCVVLKNKIQIFRTVYLLSLLVLLVLISTLINGGAILSAINTLTPLLSITFALEFYKDNEEGLAVIENIWKWLLAVLVTADFITELFFPNGLYTTLNGVAWLLGYKTNKLILILPMLILIGYRNLEKNQGLGIFFWIMYIIGILDCCFAEAASSYIALAFFIGLFILIRLLIGSEKKRRQRIAYTFMDYRFFFIVYGIILLFVLGGSQLPIIQRLISSLGRSSTLSGRTYIWAALIPLIFSKPILGLGYFTTNDFSILNVQFAVANTHNAILTVMLWSGVIGLVIYVLIVATSLKRTSKQYTEQEVLLVASIYTLFVVGITSAVMMFSVFGFLGIWMMEHERDKKSIISPSENVIMRRKDS